MKLQAERKKVNMLQNVEIVGLKSKMYAYAIYDTGDKKATIIKTLLIRLIKRLSIKSSHYCQLNNVMNFC